MYVDVEQQYNSFKEQEERGDEGLEIYANSIYYAEGSVEDFKFLQSVTEKGVLT